MARILVASASFDSAMGGGAVRLAYDLAIGLKGRGHEVTVVCEDPYSQNPEQEKVNGVTVLRYRLPRLRGLDIWRSKRHIEATKEILKKYLDYSPDVVHGHSLFQYIGALRHYRGKVRSCYTIHSPFVDELRIVWGAHGLTGQLKIIFGLPIIKRLERECLINSSMLSAESEFTRSRIQFNYGKTYSERIKVIPGWVDMKRFVSLSIEAVKATRDKLGWPNNRPILFVLRRLEARMGLENLLHALSLAKKHGYNPYTIIGGAGSMRESLTKLRDSLGLQGDVVFMGFVPADQLPLAYGSCDASIVPTAQLECFGIIALEAMACGKPVLVTPVGALPEVMCDFQTEWISRDATPKGIFDIISAFLDKRLQTLSLLDIRNIIRQKYSYESALLTYEHFLIGQNRSRNLS